MDNPSSDSATRVAAYVRAAKNELEDPQIGYQAQEAQLRAFCVEHALELVEVVGDAGVKAYDHVANRKGGRRLLTLIKEQAIDAIVAVRLDRLFHTSTQTLTHAREWDNVGVRLILAQMGDESLDTRDETERRRFFATVTGLAEMEGHEVRELRVATAVQAGRIPAVDLAEAAGMSVAGIVIPSAPCCGDWWNYYPLADDRVMVIVGDVTGHGVASAIVCSAAQQALSTLLAERSGNVDLPLCFEVMNEAVMTAAQSWLYMTCFGSIYDPRTRVLSYANAGHNFPFVVDGEKKKLSQLVLRGKRLGEQEEIEADAPATYEVKELELAPGSVIAWYTDGIVEAENMAGEEFGARRFRKLIQRNAELAPDTLRDLIINTAAEFAGEVPNRDDTTLVLAKTS